MITNATQMRSWVDTYRWQPSRWFKVRATLTPAFPPSKIDRFDVRLRTTLEPATPTIDFQFFLPRVQDLSVMFPEIVLSEDLIDFDAISTVEADIEALYLQVLVSDDLFIPLGRPRYGGRKYDRRGEKDEEQQSLLSFASATSRDKEGYRKSFTESGDRTSTTRRVMTIWDLILPLLEPPVSFEFSEFFDLPHSLYPFQVDGVKFLIDRKSALLGDDMGTGKTVQTIVAMRVLFQTGAVASALIVVPLSVLKNWDRELLKWAPTLNGVTVVRGPKGQRKVQWEKRAHIWITTFGTVRNDLEEILEHRQFDLVVLDEIQAIKNRGTEQTKAVKQLSRARAWGLSGTPIENHLDDLCSIYDFLKPGLLPRESITVDQARAAIADYFLRRRKEDVLPDLPEKKAFDIWLGMEPKQRDAYERAAREGRVWLEELGEEITVQHVLALLQRLKMLCNRDPKSGHSAKLDRLGEMVEEAVSEGSKVLVFSQYLNEGVNFIAERFDRYQPAVVTGAVSGSNRDRVVERFQSDDRCKLFVATPKSGGVGINLVAGNYVFHFDHWWNPATGLQAEDRVHRIGQQRDVFVYHFWTEGTVEERIHSILEKKQKLYSDVIDPLSNVKSSGMSEDELFGLFDLKSPKHRERDEVVSSPDQMILDRLQTQTPDEFESKKSLKHRERDEATSSLDQTILDRLLAQTADEFESKIACLYEALGFGTRITPSSRDGGIDIIASRTTPGGGTEKLAIQCKRNARSNIVGRPIVQNLLGVIARDRSFTKGVLVTTSDFTSDCRLFARGQGNLELVDGARLVRLIRQTGEEKNYERR